MASGDLARSLPITLTPFRPSRSLGTLTGGLVVVWCYGLALLLVFRGLTLDTSINQLGPFLAAGFFFLVGSLYGYWTWGCQTLTYIVDRNALTIRWGAVRQVIPLNKIERLIPGSEVEHPQIEGVSWPGHHVGRASVEMIGEALFYSTHRTMREVLYVQTWEDTYAISVAEPIVFAQAIQANLARGTLFDEPQTVRRWGVAAQSFWVDKLALALTAVLIATFAAVLGYVLSEYPDLSQSVALRFPSLGGILRVSDKSALLDIPRSAAGFLAVNLTLAVFLHSWERMVGYVLLLSGIAIQVMLLVAAVLAVP